VAQRHEQPQQTSCLAITGTSVWGVRELRSVMRPKLKSRRYFGASGCDACHNIGVRRDMRDMLNARLERNTHSPAASIYSPSHLRTPAHSLSPLHIQATRTLPPYHTQTGKHDLLPANKKGVIPKVHRYEGGYAHTQFTRQGPTYRRPHGGTPPHGIYMSPSSSSGSATWAAAARSASIWRLCASSMTTSAGARAGASTNVSWGLPASLRASHRKGFSKL